MSYAVDFNTVLTVGLESSPVGAALAGLRAQEARYSENKYDDVFTGRASDAKSTVDRVHRILKEERDIVISFRPLDATAFGLPIDVMDTVDAPRTRRSGSSFSAGMKVPVSWPPGSSSRARS